MNRNGLKITQVESGGPAARAGLAPGDEILAVNGSPVPDEIALKFHLAEELVKISVRKRGGAESALELDLSDGGDLGIRVEEFRTRTCNNACLFCFIDQLPPGVRPSLKVKDDDYRLSFLHGNYITLTNLPEKEFDRIIEQALSPLYVSVHATDPDLRTRILGRRKVDDLDRKMRRLIGGGVRIHAQIVLMPGINDGDHLERTVFDLYGYDPGVQSVAIVPLGLSDHGSPRLHYTPITPAYCRDVVAQVTPWQAGFRRERARTFAYLADEFYIQGGLELPGADHYDDFAQVEDGVGMVRSFLDEFGRRLNRRHASRAHLRGTLTTARLFHPYLQAATNRFNEKLGSRLQVLLVENLFMGKDITVAGLLAGRDFEAALRSRDLGDFVIIPGEAISRVDGVLVDNVTPADLSRRIGRPVHSSGRSVAEFFTLMLDRL